MSLPHGGPTLALATAGRVPCLSRTGLRRRDALGKQLPKWMRINSKRHQRPDVKAPRFWTRPSTSNAGNAPCRNLLNVNGLNVSAMAETRQAGMLGVVGKHQIGRSLRSVKAGETITFMWPDGQWRSS